MNNITIRRANTNNDCEKLSKLYNKVFFPERVDLFGENLFHHYPPMENKYWIMAEDTNTGEIVSALGLIPWQWEMDGIPLKVAEMGMVATLEEYRGKGLMKLLNQEFDKTLRDEGFDLAAIQGIPGFYHKFGYYYSIPLESHINLPLHAISNSKDDVGYQFRLATVGDIPFLLDEDKEYRKKFLVSVCKTKADWEYIMSTSKNNDFGSEVWIMEKKNSAEKYYFRVMLYGFGTGLIIHETSENANIEALQAIFRHCKQLAMERGKPFIRLNMHHQSIAGKYAISLGAEPPMPYAWQIKIDDKVSFVSKLKPILEKRLANSPMKGYSGTLRFDLYREGIDMKWSKGKLESVSKQDGKPCEQTFNVNADLFPAFILGHRSWQELQYIRPDINPSSLYLNPVMNKMDDISGQLVDILFSASKSWIYLPY